MVVGGLLEGLWHRLTRRGTADICQAGEAVVGRIYFELGTWLSDAPTSVSTLFIHNHFFLSLAGSLTVILVRSRLVILVRRQPGWSCSPVAFMCTH